MNSAAGLVLWLLVVPAPAAAAPLAQAPTVISFEDLESEGYGTGGHRVIESQYPGVTFNRVVLLDYSKAIPLPGIARSGTNAIETCYAGEFCHVPIELSFAQPQSRVKLWVGVSRGRPGAFRVVLEAFDGGGVLLGTASSQLDVLQGSLPIQTPLEVGLVRPQIRRALLRIDQDLVEMGGLAVDDVEFDSLVRLADLRIVGLEPRISARGVAATVANLGLVTSAATTLRLSEGETPRVEVEVPSLAPGDRQELLPVLPDPRPGRQRLRADLDPAQRVEEQDEQNNSAEVELEVPVRVPSVVGLTLGEARALLEAAGLILVLPPGQSPSEEGLVDTQSPAQGAEIPLESVVRLTLRPAPIWPIVLGALAISAALGFGGKAWKRRLERAALARVSVQAHSDPGRQGLAGDPPVRPLPHVALRFHGGSSTQAVEGPEGMTGGRS